MPNHVFKNMAEFTRKYFVCNGKLKPVSEFRASFGQPAKYIYEVFRVQDGVAIFIEDHIDRLWKTAALERIKLSFSRDEMKADILHLMQANPNGSGNIKILIKSLKDGPLVRLVYFNPHQYPTAEQFQSGVSVILFNAIRQNPNAKVMDVLLRKEIEKVKFEEKVYEVLLVDKQGNITEGGRSNVFFIKKDQLITPPVQNVLEGVTRKQIIQLCINNELPVSEQIIPQQALEQIEAVFITGTSRRVLPVSGIGTHSYNVSHPFIKKLQKLFEIHVQQYIALYKARDPLNC